jgi:hypothetical protein
MVLKKYLDTFKAPLMGLFFPMNNDQKLKNYADAGHFFDPKDAKSQTR